MHNLMGSRSVKLLELLLMRAGRDREDRAEML